MTAATPYRKGVRAGSFACDCAVCGKWGLCGKHHSKPAVAGSKASGPVWLTCSKCHNGAHEKFTNQQLRDMTLEQLRAGLGIKS